MYMPKRYWHFADQQLAIENTGNLINVGAKTIFLKEFSKRFIIHHHSNTIKERILFMYNCLHLSDVGNIYKKYMYIEKFVTDLRQVSGFLRFPTPIKLTVKI